MKLDVRCLVLLAVMIMGCSHNGSPPPVPSASLEAPPTKRPSDAPTSTFRFVVGDVLTSEGAPWCFIIGGGNRMGAYVTAKTEGSGLCKAVQAGQWVKAAGEDVMGGGTFMVVVWADSVRIIDPPS